MSSRAILDMLSLVAIGFCGSLLIIQLIHQPNGNIGELVLQNSVLLNKHKHRIHKSIQLLLYNNYLTPKKVLVVINYFTYLFSFLQFFLIFSACGCAPLILLESHFFINRARLRR